MSRLHGSVRPRRFVVGAFAVISPMVATTATAHAEDDPPEILSTSVVPAGLGYEGGTVTISVEATDDIGIASVSASIYGPDGSIDGVELSSAGSGTYSNTYDIGPNLTDSPVSWSIEVWVTDTSGGQASTFASGVEVDAQPQFDEPPTVWDPSITPDSLTAAGGEVTISMLATDLRGITWASAAITDPAGAASDIELLPIDSGRFAGTYAAPANATESAQDYAVTVAAQDDIGQETRIDAGTFTVAAASTPSSGRLSISPVELSATPIGSTSTGTVRVRHIGRQGAAPIAAAVTVTGDAYTLASPASISLAPGASTTLVVEFSPDRAGVHRGRVAVARADGAQAQLGRALTGRATRQ